MKRLWGLVLVASLPLGACDSDVGSASEGDVLVDGSYEAIDYTLTSDNYKKWLVAQEALDRAGVRPAERIDVHDVSEEDIERVTRSLEANAVARAAIDSAGLSVRDFVLTTIALAQSWDAVNGRADRVLGARPENLAFLRTQAATDGAVRQRPGAGIATDGPTADDGNASDADSDSDSDRGRGKGKGKGKGKRGRG